MESIVLNAANLKIHFVFFSYFYFCLPPLYICACVLAHFSTVSDPLYINIRLLEIGCQRDLRNLLKNLLFLLRNAYHLTTICLQSGLKSWKYRITVQTAKQKTLSSSWIIRCLGTNYVHFLKAEFVSLHLFIAHSVTTWNKSPISSIDRC